MSPFTLLGFNRSQDKRTKMAFQVKVECGGKRSPTFLLENDSLVSSIKKNCSSLAQLDADKITLCYRDKDGDMVNVCQTDFFAF